MKNIAIIGHGGHARVIEDLVLSLKEYSCRGFIGKQKQEGVVYSDEGLDDLKKDGIACLASGVGNISYPWFDEMIAKYIGRGFGFPALIHPSAAVSGQSQLGDGTVVLENAVIKARSEIGRFCIINSLSVVSHDCVIGDYVHISLGAKMGGGCQVGRNSFLGINSSVIQGKKIGKDVIVGAGAVIIDDVPDGVVVAGNPGRIVKKR